MKKLLRILTHKIVIIALAVIFEFALLFTIAWKLTSNYAIIHALLQVISFLLLLHVINRHDNPYYRFAWAVVILTIPPFGAVLYLLFGEKKVPKELRSKARSAYSEDIYLQRNDLIEDFEKNNSHWHRLIHYIYKSSHFPIYENTQGEYLESGEKKFEVMVDILEKAEKFIFLEYFIIKESYMWDVIYEILERKVQEGVDVRVIFDDWGCSLYPHLEKDLEEIGVKAVVFNPLVPRLAVQMNNRDHRKIVVVDGRYGIVGGINLADEYINRIERFGHWKDTAVLIEGEAVHSLTLMFLQIYSYYTEERDNPDEFRYDFPMDFKANGFVMPFDDAPTDEFDVGADAHLTMIHNAKKYIYIQTPYLIVGHEMMKALTVAAESGVDVRIILPHIPDKKLVNEVTKSSYDQLVQSGVRVYEYEPGFIHSKTIVVDDEIALVGTTNMDFRSYYLHFECSILFINHDVVKQCYDDTLAILDESIEITQTDLDKVSYPLRMLRSFLRIFSGLL